MKIIESAQAAITNPAVGNLGNDPVKAADGSLFLSQLVRYWNNIISVGALLLLLYFIWGALTWITASGDKTRLETARNRMLQAAIGMLILVSSFVIIGFAGNLLFGDEFQLLNFKFYTPE